VPSSSDVASRDAGSSLPRNGRSFVALRPAARFSTVYDTGTSGRAGGITVIRVPGDVGPPQVGIVASRKVGNAVQRNRAKRRIREALMNTDIRRDTAYVVIASRSVVDVDFDRLKEWLDGALAGTEKGNTDEER